ncbi:50S ribosomal protein L7/L12 [Streptococcus pneumoniae GA41410]|nr:50S ribosomal protein L7/L12 [Streptococcus pneumoniae GA41410]
MALNIENIIAEIKEASILELNDLVKAIEEEFGVTAAAPVAVAAADAADAGAAKDSFDVELTSAGDKKLALSKLYVKSLVLVLKKLKNLLTVHQHLLKKALQLQKLKKSKLNWKKLELQLLLNNRVSQFDCGIPIYQSLRAISD